MRSFKQYITEETGVATFTFGRFNPPTVGHLKLLDAVKKTASGGKYFVYASASSDAKKNPLKYEDKIKYMRKMFPTHARNIILDKSKRTVFDILVDLYDKGYSQVNMVVGSDRVPEFKALTNQYNGKEARHGYYKFKAINIVSAGERDPDSDDVSGMSASKLRAAAAENDFAAFSKGMPSNFKDVQSLFNDVRSAMGLSESFSFRQHIEFKPISEEREAYVAGELFSEGDEVVIKNTEEVATVQKCGSNYVIVECSGKTLRKWITDLEKL